MANRKVNKQSVRATQSRKRREEARKEKETFRNRIIAGVGGLLLILVVGLFIFQLSGAANDDSEEANGAGSANAGDGGSEVSVSEDWTLLEGERPLAELDPEERNGYYDEYPEMIIDTDKSYQAVIRMEAGDMKFQLYDDESPLTVNSFVFLATQGFYDNVGFHRVLPGFMAQGGDPTGSGQGGPGYQFVNEVDNGLTYDKPHLIAMANAGPDTNGSQFFITFVPTTQLNGGYTIFGELLEGADTLFSITPRNPEIPADLQIDPDKILRVDIYEQ